MAVQNTTNPDSVQVPPIRTDLKDPVNTDQTAKEWYLYWKQSGDRINTLNGMVTYGNSANRLAPANAPDGAIYVDTDLSGVIYQNQGGTWHYLAGTMYGTISPDQRPANLGVNDAGFTFRSTDTNPLLGGHTWIWSGNAWIEVTPNRYGGHGTRLSQPLSLTWNGMIWVETDRSGVIYQNQSGVWHFLAGTMWGTLSPDQRPTDLGTNDAGFMFRGTDQPRVYVWSGSAWVETTPIGGWANLIHPNVVTKVASTSGQIVEGGITDLSAAASGTVYITAAGNVGFGTTSPSGTIHAKRSDGSYELILESAAGIPRIFGLAISGGNGSLLINDVSAPAVRLAVTTAGNFVIGADTGAYQLTLTADSAGKPGTNTWAIISDIRTKRNVSRFEGDMEVIRRLDPIVAEYNGGAHTPDGMRVVSLDPQKLREIVPHAVSSLRSKLHETDAEETDILSVNTHEIFYHMLRAIQQLDQRLTSMEKTPS